MGDLEATEWRMGRRISTQLAAKSTTNGELAPCLDFPSGTGEAFPPQEPPQPMSYTNDDFNSSNLDTLLQRNNTITTEAGNPTRVTIQSDFSGLFDQNDIGIMGNFWDGMELEFGNV